MSVGYRVLFGVSWPFIQLLSPFSKKLNKGIRERKDLEKRWRMASEPWRIDCEKPYWFHFASSGELEQCLPILDEIKRREPHRKLVLTFFSPTAKAALAMESERRIAARKTPPWDYADYAPIDSPKAVRGFLAAVNPSKLIVINRELWPTLIQESSNRGVEIYLVATYFGPQSRRFFFLYRNTLAKIRAVGTVEKGTRDFLLSQHSEKHIVSLGDPRVERVLARKALKAKSAWADYFTDRKTLLLGSLWEEDFAALKMPLAQFLERHPNWRIVFVPHEPSGRLSESIQKWLYSRNRPHRFWSEWTGSPESLSDLIVDRVGFLAELYGVANIVFVGGSFKSRVHNVLEPAAYAKPILTGPYIQNSAEAVEMNSLGSGLVRVETSAGFLSMLEKWAESDRLREEAGAELTRYLSDRMGAAGAYADLLNF